MNFVSNGDEKWPIGWDWNRQDVGGREGCRSVCLSLHAPIDVCIGKLPNVMNELDKTPRRLYIFTFTSIDRLSYVLLLRQATGTDLL